MWEAAFCGTLKTEFTLLVGKTFRLFSRRQRTVRRLDWQSIWSARRHDAAESG
jgi:hypothetical protein